MKWITKCYHALVTLTKDMCFSSGLTVNRAALHVYPTIHYFLGQMYLSLQPCCVPFSMVFDVHYIYLTILTSSALWSVRSQSKFSKCENNTAKSRFGIIGRWSDKRSYHKPQNLKSIKGNKKYSFYVALRGVYPAKNDESPSVTPTNRVTVSNCFALSRDWSVITLSRGCRTAKTDLEGKFTTPSSRVTARLPWFLLSFWYFFKPWISKLYSHHRAKISNRKFWQQTVAKFIFYLSHHRFLAESQRRTESFWDRQVTVQLQSWTRNLIQATLGAQLMKSVMQH